MARRQGRSIHPLAFEELVFLYIDEREVLDQSNPMLSPGLVSVTFRQLSAEGIIDLACQAGLKSIEWGGDIHVPAGDVTRAREVGQKTREAGLCVAAYGSYYRLGVSEEQGLSFAPVLASARALETPTIRVWAGNKGSAKCSLLERQNIVDDALRVARLAADAGITISLEYHDDTLCDTQASVRELLMEMADPSIEFLWQPSHGESLESCLSRLHDVLPRLRNVHVFHWWPTHQERHPLIEGESRWRRYIEVVSETGKKVDFLLEFVSGDAPQQLLADAKVLADWLSGK